jgi:hypothetical protein
MSSAPPTYVVTCPVPSASLDQLRLDVAGRTVTAVGTSGFRHTFELPAEAATDQLEWRVYADILELRVPLRAAVPQSSVL